LAALPQNERYQQRKRERRLAKEFKEIRIDRFASPENIDLLIAQAEAVARKSYQRKIGVGFAASDFMRAWLVFLARAGWLRGYVLSLEGTPGAFWIGTLRNGVFVSDYLAFDPAFADYAPGMYLMLKAIETLAGESSGPARQIDFGGGDGVYKQRLSNRAVEEAQVHIFAPNFRGLTTNALRSTLGYVNHLLKTQHRNTAWFASVKRLWRARATGPQNRP
jgi:CelD/BcsL family acetyltransferase involved in cellulose biosynthesis